MPCFSGLVSYLICLKKYPPVLEAPRNLIFSSFFNSLSQRSMFFAEVPSCFEKKGLLLPGVFSIREKRLFTPPFAALLLVSFCVTFLKGRQQFCQCRG